MRNSKVEDIEATLTVEKEENTVAEKRPDERWKGALYMNLVIVLVALMFMVVKIIYQRHPDLSPDQMLLGRGFFSTVLVVLINNKNLLNVMYYDVPRHNFGNLALRCFQASLSLIIEFTVVKYVSLVLMGISRNLAPIITLLMSACMTGEKITAFDVLFCIASLVAITIVINGFAKPQDDIEDDGDEEVSNNGMHMAIVYGAAITIPFLFAWSTITTRRLKGLPENTVSCYVNPCLFFLMLAIVSCRGELESTGQLMAKFDVLDWSLFALIGMFSVLF